MNKSTLRVLLVDDYELWRRSIRSSLEKGPGFQVVGEAVDGPEAVRQSQELQPDLIILDIGLPTMNGIEDTREIRQLLPNLKILCCSENCSADVAEAAFRAGAGGYLVKSEAGSDLLSALVSVIQGKHFVSRALAGHAFRQNLASE